MDETTPQEARPGNGHGPRIPWGIARRLAMAGASVAGLTPKPVRHVVASAVRSLDQLPSVTEQLDVLVAEVHAQRLSLQALEAELAALDLQLGVLERSLAPVAAWGHQSSRLRASLVDVLERRPEDDEG